MIDVCTHSMRRYTRYLNETGVVLSCQVSIVFAISVFFFFFFQAEDGIRDLTVTGVQTCALPILTEAQLLSDWVLVHEMAHLALPDTGEAHAWLSEGLATYVEGVARAQAGNRSEADVWAEEMRQMPRGLPESGDRGLDRTHTWARTYWGGAMFCLMADVDIHRQSHNRFGLQDALRAIVRESGGLGAGWPIHREVRTRGYAPGPRELEAIHSRL